MATDFHFRDSESFGALGAAAGAWDDQAARTPARPRERVLELFQAPPNRAYLRRLFARQVPPGPLRGFALDTLDDAVFSFEMGEDLAYSDPLARRGAARPALDLWAEVRRLNRAFYEYRMRFIRDKSALLARGPGGGGKVGHNPAVGDDDRAGGAADDEPYHYRMFEADSLRPPGHEHLNGDGPLFGLLEDAAAPAAPAAPPGVDPEDWGWDVGDPHRTPEQALAEYWGGDGVVETGAGERPAAAFSRAAAGGGSFLGLYGQGGQWRENGGTRFMRYPTIPIWQNLSRGRAYERDIEETLGTLTREMDGHVRRWDTRRLTDPRGAEYRRYGHRSGSTV